MPNYYDGVVDGQRFAGSLQTASEGADAVRQLFRGQGAPSSWAQEAQALKVEIAQERAMRALSRATVAGLEAVIAQLPPEHMAALQAAMERTFDQVFIERAHELGVVESRPGQTAEAAAMMRRSVLGQR